MYFVDYAVYLHTGYYASSLFPTWRTFMGHYSPSRIEIVRKRYSADGATADPRNATTQLNVPAAMTLK